MSDPNAILFCDIDGCLSSGKHIALDLKAVATLRGQIKTLARRGVMFSLCTGRPQPFAEAMAQVLDIQTPMICELGAMVFDPLPDRVTPMMPETARDVIPELRHHLRDVVGVKNTHMFEPGNEHMLCITGQGIDGETYSEIKSQMAAYQALCAGIDVTWTCSTNAIDITPPGITKQTGAAYLLNRYDLTADIAYAIGDSAGDLPILNFVGHAMCPANAVSEVQEICQTIASAHTINGVVEILAGIIQSRE